MSRSIHMYSIQIDTKCLEMDSYRQINNVKLSLLQVIWLGVMYVW